MFCCNNDYFLKYKSYFCGFVQGKGIVNMNYYIKECDPDVA